MLLFEFCRGVSPKYFSTPIMSLLVPGSTSSALVLAAPSQSAPTEMYVLEPRFASMLMQAKVHPDHTKALGDARCESAAVF